MDLWGTSDALSEQQELGDLTLDSLEDFFFVMYLPFHQPKPFSTALYSPILNCFHLVAELSLIIEISAMQSAPGIQSMGEVGPVELVGLNPKNP